MNRNITAILRCPSCNNGLLLLDVTKEDGHEIVEGEVICKECDTEYPITNGVLHMLLQKDIGDYEQWNRIYEGKDISFLNEDALKKRLLTAFKDENILLNYYSLIGLAHKHHLRVKRAIEIGCGSGQYSLALKKMGIVDEVYLVDTSVNALSLAQRLFRHFDEQCSLICADGTNVPFKNKAFDLSFSAGVVEHFKGASQQEIISEHCRVAEGVLCQVPCNSMAYRILRFLLTIRYKGWVYGYEKPMTIEEEAKLFSNEDYLIKDYTYSDVITSLLFNLSPVHRFIHPVTSKNVINRIVKHEIAAYAIEKGKTGVEPGVGLQTL